MNPLRRSTKSILWPGLLPQPEGQDAQPKWSGWRLSAFERRIEDSPEFGEPGLRYLEGPISWP
jgi:hypothetical protein